VKCSADPGALRSYVVTLFQWASPEDVDPFAVGSSYPTPCSRTVTFNTLVTPGLYYTGEIDGYEQVAAALVPFGGASSGARYMLDATTSATVSPRWTTRCGHAANDATLAIANEARFLTSCDALVDSTPTAASIQFPPEAALGADPCKTAPTFDIHPEGSGLPPATGVLCDAPAVSYVDGVQAGQGYYFYVTALAGTVELGTECFATASPGIAVTPLCNAISSSGDIELSLAGLTVGATAVCPAGGTFNIALAGKPLNAAPLSCSAQAHIGPLSAGPTSLDIAVRDSLGASYGPGATCTAAVEPGRSVHATCAAAGG